eukprot:10838466-Alexandrium_andersonii.AAC.1
MRRATPWTRAHALRWNAPMPTQGPQAGATTGAGSLGIRGTRATLTASGLAISPRTVVPSRTEGRARGPPAQGAAAPWSDAGSGASRETATWGRAWGPGPAVLPRR